MHMQFIKGGVYIDGALRCEAVLGKPIAPAGTYGIVILHSSLYERDLPHLSNVPHCGDVCIGPSAPSPLGVGSGEGEKTPSTPLKTGSRGGLEGGERVENRFEALFSNILVAMTRKEPVVMEVIKEPFAPATVPLEKTSARAKKE